MGGGNQVKIVDTYNRTIDSSNPLPVSATINVGDIEIGAVEIKDHDGSDRLAITDNYAALVELRDQNGDALDAEYGGIDGLKVLW